MTTPRDHSSEVAATELLTLPQLLEAAPWLTERWVRSMVHDGRLPRRKVGGRLLFHLSDLDPLIRHGYGPGSLSST